MSRWNMSCLICEETSTNLVGIQEHVMNVHGYTQNDLRKQTSREINPGHWVYIMPDGKEWLNAKQTPLITDYASCPHCHGKRWYFAAGVGRWFNCWPCNPNSEGNIPNGH